MSTYNSLFPQPIESPQSALYAFLPISAMGIQKNISSVALCEELIKKDNLALVPGIAFGKEEYVRFAFSETESEFMKGYTFSNQLSIE